MEFIFIDFTFSTFYGGSESTEEKWNLMQLEKDQIDVSRLKNLLSAKLRILLGKVNVLLNIFEDKMCYKR